jgi:hypothetical protein
VQTHQINISKGREGVHEIRSELFAFPEVLDVFVTGQPDSLVVICCGRPRLGEWLGALRAVGYDVPARQHATATVSAVEPSDIAATSDGVPVRPPIDGTPRRAAAGTGKSMKQLARIATTIRSTADQESVSITGGNRRLPPEARVRLRSTNGQIPAECLASAVDPLGVSDVEPHAQDASHIDCESVVDPAES